MTWQRCPTRMNYRGSRCTVWRRREVVNSRDRGTLRTACASTGTGMDLTHLGPGRAGLAEGAPDLVRRRVWQGGPRRSTRPTTSDSSACWSSGTHSTGAPCGVSATAATSNSRGVEPTVSEADVAAEAIRRDCCSHAPCERSVIPASEAGVAEWPSHMARLRCSGCLEGRAVIQMQHVCAVLLRCLVPARHHKSLRWICGRPAVKSAITIDMAFLRV